MKSSPLVFIATVVLAAASSPNVQASCNVIPDAESAEIGAAAVLAAQDSPVLIPPSERGLIGFKGALGRMDRIQLLPGQTESFRLQPDGQCIQASKERLIVGDVATRWDADLLGSDLVVSLVTKAAHGDGVRALILGSSDTCRTLAGIKKSETREPGIALRCEPLPPVFERGDGGKINVRVRLPADGRLLGADEMPLRGSVAVALTRGLQSRAEHEALLSSIAADGCAANCSALGETDALACIDQFYAVLAGGTAVSDPIPCAVTIPPGFSKNDFMEKCEDLSPSPNSDLAECEDKRTILKLWDDQCGGVHIPFDWARIRKDNSTDPPSDITRWVAGRSATSRTEKGKLASERIWIPGREFIGTTPFKDAQGTAASIDWRKPEIDVWYPAESPKEVGLRGTVDQADSIVHVFPRMPVTLACDGVSGDEACMGVEGGGGISCACEDRYPANCSCKLLSPPLFFACEGGDFDEMPCTRHAHCNSAPGSSNADGTCSRQPTCQQDGQNGVWQAPGPAPTAVPTAETACWVNDTCQQVANRPWCGYRLFDLSDRMDGPSIPTVTPAIELDAEIVKAGRARRGVCAGNRGKVCNHNEANGCDGTADEGVCRGYTLRAEGKQP